MRHPYWCLPLAALLVSSGAACLREGIDQATECQFQSKNDIWRDYGFNLSVNEPTVRNCPVSLDFFGEIIDLAAVVDAPAGTPLLGTPFFYRFFDANNSIIGFGSEFFARGASGRDVAQINDRYLAGLAGDRTVNQDRVNTEVAVTQTSAKAVFLPGTTRRRHWPLTTLIRPLASTIGERI